MEEKIEKLVQIISNIKRWKDILDLDEANTKYTIILPILEALGWNTKNPDEVRAEESVGPKAVDFALKHNGLNFVFLEVKKPSENLEKHEEQILSYSFDEGVPQAVLTNGIEWRFYLPMKAGVPKKERKFCEISLLKEKEEIVAKTLYGYLGKENVTKGESKKLAENELERQHHRKKTREKLPEAWNRILEEPHRDLIGLISEKLREWYSFEPDEEVIRDFLKGLPRTTMVLEKDCVSVRKEIVYSPIAISENMNNLEEISPEMVHERDEVKILFCRIGLMNRYQGLENDGIVGGGDYVKENKSGFEIYNFKPYNGKMYGYVQPPGTRLIGKHQINIQRISSKCNNEYVSGVLVVWVATDPTRGGQYIVGWYKNATVYREYQHLPEDSGRVIFDGNVGKNVIGGYYITADEKDCCLLEKSERTFPIPKATKGKGWGMGQSNIWYAEERTPEVIELIKKVMNYINYVEERRKCRSEEVQA